MLRLSCHDLRRQRRKNDDSSLKVCRHWRVLQCDEAMRFATSFIESREIRLHFAVCFEGGEGSFKDGCCASVVWPLDAVVHPLPFPPSADDSGVAEIGEMAGYLRLALIQNLDEVADADLAAVHQVE